MKSRSHRLPTISDTPDDWVDESWTVDCVCGVNFDDGEEMVDCDECGVWVHTRCSRYVKSEKLFSCDKCKSKKIRKENEETEVAQLLVELPTKTLRMDNNHNPYPLSFPQSSLQVWTEIPLEEKVHVHGIPGGDPSLFTGVSSVFSQQLWKCTGYVPKKFNSQYREFPCWNQQQQQDDDDDDDDKDLENPACKGADALFSLSTSGLDMGPPSTDTKKQDVRKERSLLKKDESKVVKDQNRKKNVKSMDKDGDSKKRSFESVSTTSSDAKQSESYEGKGHKVSKTDKQSSKHENSRTDVNDNNHKSDDKINISVSSERPSEITPVDDSRLNPSNEAKQMEENDGNQVPTTTTTSVEISESSLKQNPLETSTTKDEVKKLDVVVDDANKNEKSCSTSNGPQPNMSPKADLHSPLPPTEVKPLETNHPEKTSNSQNAPTSDVKSQDTKSSDDRLSPSIEVKKESHSQIHKVQNLDSGVPNQRKITGKPSSKQSVQESGKQKHSSENNTKIKKDKSAKEIPKSPSTSTLKPSHLSKSSKKNSSESKDPAILSSSKTTTTTTAATPDSGDSANSLRSENGGNEQQKGEKIISHQIINRTTKVHTSQSTTTNLSDEELALLLHQELNSSPRVPRVPRMRHAGSLPQLASTTPGTTLMKRTSSSSGGKDNNNGTRKRNKDSTGREFEGVKKGERTPAVPTSKIVKNGSANRSAPPVTTTVSSGGGPSSDNEANEHNNNMLSPQNGSEDEVPTHRTLPGLIAEIMSKGKRMTYEELCNAVLPHWPNLRKHNGERYAYSSHSQAVLDCLRNRSEWSRLVDRGPKTNAGRKRRKSEADLQNVESEEEQEQEDDDNDNDDDDYSTDKNTKDAVDNNKSVGDDEIPKGKRKRKTRKHRRLAMQGTRIKRRRKVEVVSEEEEDDDVDSSSSDSDSSEESAFSDEGEGGRRTSVANEASASSES